MIVKNRIIWSVLFLIYFLIIVCQSKSILSTPIKSVFNNAQPEDRRDWNGAVLQRKMKKSVSAYPCVLLLGPKGKTYGCSQPHNEMSGTLQYLKKRFDVKSIKPEYKETVFVLEPDDFRTEKVRVLIDMPETQGLIILWGHPDIESSPDLAVPNQGFGTETSFKWNPNGDGLSMESFEKPIWLAHELNSDLIEEAAINNSAIPGYPKNGAVFYTTMNAGRDSETCLRRGKCLPVGGQSVISSLRQLPNGTAAKDLSVIFASTRLDSTSFFHDYVTGSDAYTSGLIALLAAQVALHDYLGQERIETLRHDIVFAYFQGESYGYLGSSTFVNDVVNFTCKTVKQDSPDVCEDPYMSSMRYLAAKIDRSIGIIDAGQVGYLATSDKDESTLYIHTTEHGQKEQQQRLQKAFETAAASVKSPSLKINFVANDTRGLPPSSAMAFLKARSDIPVAVVAEHEAEFTNPFYQSHYDDSKLNATRLCSLSTMLARTLLLAANESVVPSDMETNLTADCSFIQDLVYCMTVNFKCPIVENLFGDISSGTGAPIHISKYTSVFGSSPTRLYVHTYTRLIGEIIANRTHDAVGDSCNQTNPCDTGFSCIGVPPNATCMRAPYVHHNAKSTGIQYIDGGWKIVDETKPLYTESYWSTLSLALTTVDNPVSDVIVLVVGLLSFIILIILACITENYVYVHFKLD